MNGRSRIMIVVLGAVTAATTGGCASTGDRPSSVPFQPGELRSVPDPVTLLTADLRQDMRLDEDRRSGCQNSGFHARSAVTMWVCTLRPPQGRKVTLPKGEADPSARGAMLRIQLEVHHPKGGRTATALAAAGFADDKRLFGPAARPLRAGDEGFISPDEPGEGEAVTALVRARNVVFSISAALYPALRRPTLAELERLSARVATEMGRSLKELQAERHG
ncbi:hypothetical protein [Actinomadura sp. NPDC000929]|uniref:hypothetical protein n=1 Tax=Actinomadura sp. NPDC000929 TaxID=3154517 RepID=UPI00339175E4